MTPMTGPDQILTFAMGSIPDVTKAHIPHPDIAKLKWALSIFIPRVYIIWTRPMVSSVNHVINLMCVVLSN